MTTKPQKLFLVTIMTLLFSVTACKKDISIPNPELEKLFGTWNWVQSSGGFSGQAITPTTAGYSQTVEFNQNGSYKIYENGKQKDKMKFSLSSGNSIHSTETAYLIKYKDSGLFDKENNSVTQSVRFGGNDTLFLSDECYDCYQHIYIRQK